jgi:drug/metabolite transporter (DMT)-like permease
MLKKKKLFAVEPLVAVVFWGYAFTGIATALRAGVKPLNIVTLRMMIAAVGFVSLYATGYVRFRSIEICDWPRLLLITAIGILAYHLALVNGQRNVAAGTASLIATSTAVWTYLFSVVRGSQKWSWNAVAGLCIATAGILVVVSQRGISATNSSWESILLVFCAPVSLALYTILAKPLLRYGATNLTAQIVILAAIVLGGLQVTTSELSFPVTVSGGIAIVLTGVLSTLVAYTLWFRALESLPPTTVAAYSYLTPIFGNAFAFVILGEPITWRLVAGAVTIVVGLTIIAKATSQSQN